MLLLLVQPIAIHCNVYAAFYCLSVSSVEIPWRGHYWPYIINKSFNQEHDVLRNVE